jgi:hypothetical protein
MNVTPSRYQSTILYFSTVMVATADTGRGQHDEDAANFVQAVAQTPQ